MYVSILSQITPNKTLVITGNDRVNISLTWTSPDNNLNEITICGHLGSDIEAELRQLPLIVGKSHCEMEAMAFKVTIYKHVSFINGVIVLMLYNQMSWGCMVDK